MDDIVIEKYTTLSPDLYDDGESWRYFFPTSVCAGDSFSVGCDIRNGGSGDAGGFKARFYASTNTTISTSDYYIAEQSIGGVIWMLR